MRETMETFQLLDLVVRGDAYAYILAYFLVRNLSQLIDDNVIIQKRTLPLPPAKFLHYRQHIPPDHHDLLARQKVPEKEEAVFRGSFVQGLHVAQ
jgi:hypothetical protein